MKRTEIENKYKWDAESVISGAEEFERLAAGLKAKTAVITGFKGRLSDRETLLRCFAETDEAGKLIERLHCYAMLKRDENGADTEAQARYDRAYMMYVEFSTAVSFIIPELTALPDEIIKAFIADAAFADYDYSLKEILREKAHVLSEAEEKLLAAAGGFADGFHNIFGMLDDVDMRFGSVKNEKGERVKLSHGTYSMLLQNQNQNVRRAAFKAYYKPYKAHINTLAANYAGNVKKNVFYSEARKYPSCLAKALEGEDIPSEVYENLLSGVTENLPTVHAYAAYRKKKLERSGNLDGLHMYDMYVPLVENADLKLSYEEAYKLVCEGLKPLGEEYQNLLKDAYNNSWIDVYETENKRSGAYSCGVYGVHPYVLLNYRPTTHDVFTIAHEVGHALHSYYSNKTQPYHKADYRIFVAEVASTVNEVLLLKHLLKEKAGDKQLTEYLTSYYLDMFRTTLFRQTMFAEFEKAAHESAAKGGPLTQKSLSDMYYALNKKYYGGAVVHDDEIRYEWSRIPHFYRAFYVYKYATGLTSAVCLAEDIVNNGAPAVERYKKFLCAGGGSPYVILKNAGVDLKTKEPFDVAMRSFRDALASLNLS